jgi:probable addiction module antidote protein
VYFKQRGQELLFFWLAEINGRKQRILRPPCASHAIFRSNYMKKTVTSRYDVAEHLRTPKEMAAYLEACLEEADGDAAFIAKALGDIARAKGMTQVASDAGLSRESLYKALSGQRSPSFDTILKVVEALGLKLHAEVGAG